MFYPVWLNADIVKGPVSATTTPVDPERFLKGAKKFKQSILSIGWTTRYGLLFPPSSYTDEQLENMLNIIKNNHVTQSITFPVRAGIAAESLYGMKTILESTPNSTLTIWSSEGDRVNVENLRQLIREIGLNKVYVDVPDALKNQLHLEDFHDYIIKKSNTTTDKS